MIMINQALIFLSTIHVCLTQNLMLLSPSDFVETYHNNKIKVISSPVGFKPKSGTLYGKIALASPLSACTQVQPVGDFESNQDIFLLADDSGCLQSVKAQNLGQSGAYIGIIKRNISNTLHDRQLNVALIPILQIQPNDYDRIISYMKKNPEASINVIADFNPQVQNKKINMELWLSPTQQKTYQYILDFQTFITNQPQKIGFYPRYVLHSQTSRKQYIGCYSSGRFCPAELEFEGKPEGAKVVGQALRQIIIATKGIKNWFNYAYNFQHKCLKTKSLNLWQDQNIQICSQTAMMSSSIKTKQIFNQFKNSFQGSRPQVDSNIYLEQERQLYLQEKISKFPILIINGKQYALEDPQQVKLRICTMIHPDPTQQTQQCQLLTNPPLFTTAQICIGIGIFLIIMVIVMILCKKIIYKRMKKQMKSQVDKTLSQYYRYMQTFEQPNPTPPISNPLMEQKAETTQIGSVELSQIKSSK